MIAALFAGPMAKAIGIGALVLVLVIGVAAIRQQIRNSALAEANATALQKQLEIERADRQKAEAELQRVSDEAAKLSKQEGEAHAAVHAAPISSGCSASAAFRAALSVMRATSGGGGSAASTGATATPDMP